MNEKQPQLTGKDQWVVFKRLLSYLKPHKKVIAIALFLLILTVTGDILGPYLIKTYMDDFLTPRYFPTGPLVGLALRLYFYTSWKCHCQLFSITNFPRACTENYSTDAN